MEKLKVLDLFSGIGGFSLGLERTGGFKTIAFVEIDNYCQRVLHKHWPEVYIHSDIRTLTARHFDGYQRPDVICGGFPCQDISAAGRRVGISGERSGLWKEYLRLIEEVAPRFAIIENVAALLGNGMDVVLRDLSEGGYDTEWQVISAADVGAPHVRERVWIVAYPSSNGRPRKRSTVIRDRMRGAGILPQLAGGRSTQQDWNVADSSSLRQQGPRVLINPSHQEKDRKRQAGHAFDVRIGEEWKVEPSVGRVADGIPNRVHRLRALGNSIVPQIATWIGQRILEAESAVPPATSGSCDVTEADGARKQD